MTKRIVREIERIDCEDEDGNEYVAVVYQDFLISEAMGRAPQELPGLKELRLSDGSHLNWIDDNTFQIVANDKVLKRT